MKSFLLPLISILLITESLCQTAGEQKKLEQYTGNYFFKLDPSNCIVIRKEGDGLTMEFVGQGRVSISEIGKDRFRASRVRPKAILEFEKDQAGQVTLFKWVQPIPTFHFERITSVIADSSSQAPHPFAKYTGNYRLTSNRNRILKVRVENDHLTAQGTNEGILTLERAEENQFTLTDKDLKLVYDFIPGKDGTIQAIKFNRTGSPECIKTNESFGNTEVVYGFNRPNGFTKADTLRGKLTPLRTCYDVLFYDLNVSVDPTTKTIIGTNKIRFKAMTAFDRMQVDLFANMQIEKILYHAAPLSYTREFNAVFIQFPTKVEAKTTDELTIIYSGKPQTPDVASLAGGVFWLQDKEGQHWIETVTQGSGASLWWPCKDHLSDKPDSMKISVTVPRGLTDISNGRLLRKVSLPGNLTRFEWYVSYPITNYCVALNIGNYVHFTDQYISGKDTLPLHFYSQKTDLAVAKKFFKHTKPMLSVFEKSFGNYPFASDGFTVMQSIYPMEHQSAVSIGSIFNPFNSEKYDSLDVLRTMWHECAHEWWGNNVTVKDMADLWIYEAFATYAEVLAYEQLQGPAAMNKYLNDQKPENKAAMIGKYDVNDFRLGDIYSKGSLMLHTLRNLINNDGLWFELLRGIQSHFAFQTITTKQLVEYINTKTQTDYTYFFEQYLTEASIPELQLQLQKDGSNLRIKYRWQSAVANFHMPIKVTTTKDVYGFIYPTMEWKEMTLTDLKVKDFKIRTDQFYVAIKKSAF